MRMMKFALTGTPNKAEDDLYFGAGGHLSLSRMVQPKGMGKEKVGCRML